MGLSNVRGLLLEEIVLHLLRRVGYRTIAVGEEDTRAGPAGLEVQGRGEWHQADAFAAWDCTPAFMYPLRLVLEAKCYAGHRPVNLNVVRSVVGVVKDLAENYFSFRPDGAPNQVVATKRFNYHAAVFATSGYTGPAQRYAIAHQVFLIQYERVSLMEPVIQGLLGVTQQHLATSTNEEGLDEPMSQMRRWARAQLGGDGGGEYGVANDVGLTDAGREYVLQSVFGPLQDIRGSYFGTLSGKWPMHLLSTRELPPQLFARTDIVPCKLYGRGTNRWAFVPSQVDEGAAGWFRLEFDLPDQIAEMVAAAGRDAAAIANVKKRQFPFLDVAGVIGGVRRNIRLQLDEEWLDEYIRSRRSRSAQ